MALAATFLTRTRVHVNPDDTVFECPVECHGRVEGCWVIPDVYTVLRGCRLYPGSHPGSFL